MNTIKSGIDNLIRLVMGISALVLSTVTMLQVITRFIFKSPVPWGQDIIRLSFVYLVFWGGAYCVRMSEHLNIDVLLTALPAKVRRICEIIISLICIAFFAFLVYYGVQFALSGSSQKAPYLDLSMTWFYSSLPTAALFMFIYEVFNLIDKLKPAQPEQGGAV